MARPGRRVTALDVARTAGVSKTTVSYVLNQTPHQSIPEGTRQRVLDAVRELNYTPLSAARALRTGRNDIVLLVIPDWPLGRVLALIFDGLADEFERKGLSLVIRRQRPGQPLTAMWRELVPAAVIALAAIDATDRAAITDAGIFVATALLSSPASAQSAVVVPQDLIGALQARHLIERGHRHLAYAVPTDPRLGPFRDLRLQGAQQACRDLGIDEPRIVDVDTTRDSATRSVRLLRDQSPSVRGVMAYNDDVGGALLAGARVLGLRVPQDLAVIGVDNEPLGRFTSPALTTIDQNHERVAAELARVVISGTGGAGTRSTSKAGSEVLTLVVREST